MSSNETGVVTNGKGGETGTPATLLRGDGPALLDVIRHSMRSARYVAGSLDDWCAPLWGAALPIPREADDLRRALVEFERIASRSVTTAGAVVALADSVRQLDARGAPANVTLPLVEEHNAAAAEVARMVEEGGIFRTAGHAIDLLAESAASATRAEMAQERSRPKVAAAGERGEPARGADLGAAKARAALACAALREAGFAKTPVGTAL